MEAINKIGVFCGSSMGSEPVFKQEAERLGKMLVENNIELVYGGANIGLMKILANTVLEKGGRVSGVMPDFLAQKEIVHRGITNLHIVHTMHERKHLMAKLSDAFIAMPGGFGTLDEVAEALTWYQLEILIKPVALFNVNGYFNHLIRFLDHCVETRFLRTEHRGNIIIEDQPDRLLERIKNFKPVEVDSKWVDELKLM
jgi:uncharacterized protein (TIGR00730 family)